MRGVYGWSIGEGSTIDYGLKLHTIGGVSIGRGCNLNEGCTFDGRGRLIIGDFVNISPAAVLLTASHVVDSPDFGGVSASVHIESRVWIATRAMVLPGVRVGEGSLVAAGAVVTKDVPPGMVVAGNPARVIRPRAVAAQQHLPQYRRAFH